jgi:hypothetical protein
MSQSSIVVASSSAPNLWKSQSDYVCDGIADDVQINAAIVAANQQGGGIVQLTQGAYNAAQSINLLDNVILQGAGYSTAVCIPGSISVRLYQKKNVTLRDFLIDGTGNQSYSIEIGNSSDVNVNGIWIENAENFALFCYAQPGNTTERVRIVNNYISQNNGAQDTIGGGKTVSDPTAIIRDITIENNTIVKNPNGGTNLNTFDMVAVAGLTFTDNNCYGYVVTGTEQGPNYQCKFVGNTIHPAIGNDTTKLDIDSLSTDDVAEGILISDNVIDQGYIKINGAVGHITRHCIITGNIVYSDALVHGIWVNRLNGAVINSNLCTGPKTAGKYGILIQTSTNVMCNGNNVDGYDIDIFDNETDASNVVVGNIATDYITKTVAAYGYA